MAKQVATPKQTGGGGFAFEDQVGAWFLLLMLLGEKPFPESTGLIKQVCFQKRVDGWLLDDLVLHLRDAATESKAAISVKSNAQLTQAGFPKEFVRDIWEQSSGGDPFDVAHDLLCLATTPVEGKIRTAWNGLEKKAAVADENAFEARLSTPNYSNQIERDFFASLACPSDLAASKTSADTVRLLRQVRHIEFDFELLSSDRASAALAMCREALRNEDSGDAAQLWCRLQQMSRDYRVSGGDLLLQSLAERLKADFYLLDYPEYRADWQKLHEATDFELEQVADSLAGSTRLELPQIEVPPENGILAIVGVSGSGKSAAAKRFFLEKGSVASRLWLTPDSLNFASPATLLSSLVLRFPVLELVQESFLTQRDYRCRCG